MTHYLHEHIVKEAKCRLVQYKWVCVVCEVCRALGSNSGLLSSSNLLLECGISFSVGFPDIFVCVL